MDFDAFLTEYQAACARADTNAIMRTVDTAYEGDYFYPAGNYRRFDRAALEEGWRASEAYFAPGGARWVFENVATARREDERIVASWVSFLVHGQATGHSFLVATFRQGADGWKLVREHMQHRVEPLQNARASLRQEQGAQPT